MATPEENLDAVVLQGSEMLDVIGVLKDGVETRISDAVIVSENATQIPLITMATSLINTQSIFISKSRRI